jgi:superfamily II DNA helicase RecQ
MQVKIFTIPIIGGESLNEEMNLFLRSKRVIQIENRLATQGDASFWTMYVKYLEENASSGFATSDKEKIDHKAALDEASAKRFETLREIRKALCQAENIPAYTIFTNQQLAELAKIENLDLTKMKTVKGIGDKIIEKYGKHFVELS